MPKYLVTSSSHFEPFTYEELVRPVAHMQQVHDATQDAYDTLSLETNALANYITDNPEDYNAKVMYDNYVNKLNTLQNNLQRNGVNGQTRRDLSEARAGYASDITRLAKIIQDREERSKEFWEAKHKNPDLVTGKDPGLSGLDNYLADPNYGRDWFSYDSAQFEKDVFNETKSRAQELLRGLEDPNSIIKNPNLKDYVTRKLKYGLTNDELNMAGVVANDVINMTQAEREDYYTNNNIDPITKILSESLISRYEATGIKASDADDTERMRLFNRGKAGWVGGIMAPEIKDFKDADYEWEMEKRKMALQHQYAKDLEDYKAGLKQKEEGQTLSDTDTKVVPSQSGVKVAKEMKDAFGSDTLNIVNGQEVKGGAKASDIVYSYDTRRKAFEDIGIDVGLDPNKFATDNYLTGTTVGSDGKTYEVQYWPKAKLPDGSEGGIRYRELGDNTPWRKCNFSKDWTNRYREYRQIFEDKLEYYKKNYPDLYKAATVDPDKSWKMMKEEPEITNPVQMSLEEFRNYKSEKYPEKIVVERTYVTRDGTDKGDYLERIGGWLAPEIPEGKNKDFIAYDGQTQYLHLMGEDDKPEFRAITNPSEYFTIEDGKITNLVDFQLSEDGIMRCVLPGKDADDCYMIATNNKGKEIAVGVNMFNSDSMRSAFKKAANEILAYTYNPYMSSDEKHKKIVAVKNNLASKMRTMTGYVFSYQSKGGTNKDDTN